MHTKSFTWLATITLGLTLTAAAGCEDPATGKPKAQVGSAQPTATAPSVKPTASATAVQDKPASANAAEGWKNTPDN